MEAPAAPPVFPLAGRQVRLVESSWGRRTVLGAQISGCEGRGGVGVGVELLMRAMDSPLASDAGSGFSFGFRYRQWKDGVQETDSDRKLLFSENERFFLADCCFVMCV